MFFSHNETMRENRIIWNINLFVHASQIKLSNWPFWQLVPVNPSGQMHASPVGLRTALFMHNGWPQVGPVNSTGQKQKTSVVLAFSRVPPFKHWVTGPDGVVGGGDGVVGPTENNFVYLRIPIDVKKTPYADMQTSLSVELDIRYHPHRLTATGRGIIQIRLLIISSRVNRNLMLFKQKEWCSWDKAYFAAKISLSINCYYDIERETSYFW